MWKGRDVRNQGIYCLLLPFLVGLSSNRVVIGGLMTIRIIVLCMLLLFPLPVSAENDSFEAKNFTKIDGNDWINWPDHTRLIMVYGVVCGMNMTVQGMNNDSKSMTEWGFEGLDLKSQKIIDKYSVNGVTIFQLYKGIEEIYSHPKYRNIMLNDMIYFVSKWIKGCGEDEFERVLKYLIEKGAIDAADNLIVRRDDGVILGRYYYPQ